LASLFPFKLYGGALRPDAITGLTPRFRQSLLDLFNAAPSGVQGELGLTSAYRSPEVQARLYNASDRTGRTVAAPGRSRHNFGDAADLFGFGLKGNPLVSQATRDWVHQHAPQFNLNFPMNYEPWHIQLAKMLRPEAQAEAPLDGANLMDQAPAPAPAPAPEDQSHREALSGILHDLMQPVPISPVPDLRPQDGGGGGGGGGGGQGGGVQSLPEYVQKFIAMRMLGGQGGQGFG
jgi:hypothetical protein